MATKEVIGRNGYIYDAKHLTGNLYVVGKFIVRVEDGKVTDTVAKATKARLTEIIATGNWPTS
jgi:hypothetical protein